LSSSSSIERSWPVLGDIRCPFDTVEPLPTGSGQATSHGSAIYRAHQQTQRASPEIQPDCPLSLEAWAYSKPAIYLSLHLSHRVIMPPGSSTNDDGTQGYLSGGAPAARNQGAPCTPIPPRVAAALPQSGGHQERVLSSCFTCMCAATRQIR
jgi:hypothetical protein